MERHGLTVGALHALGFTDSYRAAAGGVRVRCTQCEALVINGHPTHEAGCPNQTFACKGCDNRVQRRGAYCGDCQ